MFEFDYNSVMTSNSKAWVSLARNAWANLNSNHGPQACIPRDDAHEAIEQFGWAAIEALRERDEQAAIELANAHPFAVLRCQARADGRIGLGDLRDRTERRMSVFLNEDAVAKAARYVF